MRVLELSSCKGKKTAILGDMFELGEESENLHYGVGLFARNLNIDTVIAVGRNAAHIAEGAAGGNAEAVYYEDVESLKKELGRFAGVGDIILVKGSRGMKLERIVEELKKL